MNRSWLRVLLVAVCLSAFALSGTNATSAERRLFSRLYALADESATEAVAEGSAESPSEATLSAQSESGQESSEIAASTPAEAAGEQAASTVTGASAIGPSGASGGGASDPAAVANSQSSQSSSRVTTSSQSAAANDDGEGLNEGKVEDLITKVIMQIGRGQIVELGNENNGKRNDIIVNNKNFMHKRDATKDDIAQAAAIAAMHSGTSTSTGSTAGASSKTRKHVSSRFRQQELTMP